MNNSCRKQIFLILMHGREPLLHHHHLAVLKHLFGESQAF